MKCENLYGSSNVKNKDKKTIQTEKRITNQGWTKSLAIALARGQVQIRFHMPSLLQPQADFRSTGDEDGVLVVLVWNAVSVSLNSVLEFPKLIGCTATF